MGAIKPKVTIGINIFIGITDIYKQNNNNSTIGFRNKQMLFLNLFPMLLYGNKQKNVFQLSACPVLFVKISGYICKEMLSFDFDTCY